jgi:hypothetical protein
MDRTSKLIMAAIAAGLWANFAVSILRPSPAAAQSLQLNEIASNLNAIYNGICLNHKIC